MIIPPYLSHAYLSFAPNHEQHSHWQQIKPLHKRAFAHRFCKFERARIGAFRALPASAHTRAWDLRFDNGLGFAVSPALSASLSFKEAKTRRTMLPRIYTCRVP